MSSKIIFTIFIFTSASTLHYIVSLILSVVLCSSGCFQGPPLPNKPFITVWNTPTDRCEPEWNVSLDLSAFDIVVNKDQKWCGEYIVIFYDTQLGLYPYFDSNGKAFNGGVPQVADRYKRRETLLLFINQHGSHEVTCKFAAAKLTNSLISPRLIPKRRNRGY